MNGNNPESRICPAKIRRLNSPFPGVIYDAAIGSTDGFATVRADIAKEISESGGFECDQSTCVGPVIEPRKIMGVMLPRALGKRICPLATRLLDPTLQ